MDNHASTSVDWFSLPSSVWYRILGSLAVSDVAAFSSSSSSAYTLTLDDIGVWKQRCIDAGALCPYSVYPCVTLEKQGLPSYSTRRFHPIKPCFASFSFAMAP